MDAPWLTQLVPVQTDPHAIEYCVVGETLSDDSCDYRSMFEFQLCVALEPGVSTYASQAVSCLQAKYAFARELKAPTSPKMIATSVSRLKDQESSKLLAIVTLYCVLVGCSVLAANVRVLAVVVRFFGSCDITLVAMLGSRLGVQNDCFVSLGLEVLYAVTGGGGFIQRRLGFFAWLPRYGGASIW